MEIYIWNWLSIDDSTVSKKSYQWSDNPYFKTTPPFF